MRCEEGPLSGSAALTEKQGRQMWAEPLMATRPRILLRFLKRSEVQQSQTVLWRVAERVYWLFQTSFLFKADISTPNRLGPVQKDRNMCLVQNDDYFMLMSKYYSRWGSRSSSCHTLQIYINITFIIQKWIPFCITDKAVVLDSWSWMI